MLTDGCGWVCHQIVVEEFLEDINNILNSGEVPNLFEPDEYEKLIIGCRPGAKEAGIAEGNRDAIYDFCINRVRYVHPWSLDHAVWMLWLTLCGMYTLGLCPGGCCVDVVAELVWYVHPWSLSWRVLCGCCG